MPITITQGRARMTRKSLEGKNAEHEDSETSYIAGEDMSALGGGSCDDVSLDGEGKGKKLQVKGFLKPSQGQMVKEVKEGSTFLILARMEKKGGAPQLVYLDGTNIGGGYPPDNLSLALIHVAGKDKIEIKGFALPPSEQLTDYATNVGVSQEEGSSASENLRFLARDDSGAEPVLKFVNFCGGLKDFQDPSEDVKRLTLRTCITPDVTTAGTILDKILFPVWDTSDGTVKLSYTTLDSPKIVGGNYAFVTTVNGGKEISIEGVHYISGDNTNVVFSTTDNLQNIKVDVYYK